MSAASSARAAPRAICGACRRPEVVCYCRLVTRFATRTRVVILQHPRERDVPINTARIASLCLPEAEVHVGVEFGGPRARPMWPDDRPAALLFPGDDAIDVEESPFAGAAGGGPISLVVVDGTWWQAKKLVRSNPAVAALPRVSFRPRAPSEYRIRKEPRDDYVSTIEALAHVLGVLEGDRDRFRGMLAPFRAMVDAQLGYAARSRAPRRLSPRAPSPPADPRDRLPALLRACAREREGDRESARRLVCVHAEADAWPYDASERAARPDALVQWVACRPETGETFDALVAPRRPLCPTTPRHLDVDARAIARGATLEAIFSAWSRFARADDVVCAWGDYAPALFLAEGGTLAATRIDLRRAARVFARARVGTLDAFCDRLGLARPAVLTASGRAGRRIASLVALARHFASPA